MSNARPGSRRGRLLVASPSLTAPSFRRTVVLMLEHSAEGALGLVLNRPTPLVAREALPQSWGEALPLPASERVHEGGPVQPEAVILLAEVVHPGPGATIVFDRVGVIDPEAGRGGPVPPLASVRAFGGYAGWGPGQLDREVEEEAWIDAVGRVEDVFTDTPALLWARVLERKGGSYRLIARMPEDPTVN